MADTKGLKLQAWILLTATSALFGRWQHSVDAGLFFGVFVLLVGTIITGYLRSRK